MKRNLAVTLYSAVLVSALCFVSPAHAAVDMLLTATGIEGGSRLVPGGIDVFSYSHGMTNVTDTTTGGAGAGKAVFQNLSITISLDKATPKLMESCANGRPLTEVVLYVRKNTDKPSYLVIKLEEVLVSSVQMGGSNAEDNLGAASVSLAYTKITTTTVIDDMPQAFNWDLVANVSITATVPPQ